MHRWMLLLAVAAAVSCKPKSTPVPPDTVVVTPPVDTMDSVGTDSILMDQHTLPELRAAPKRRSQLDSVEKTSLVPIDESSSYQTGALLRPASWGYDGIYRADFGVVRLAPDSTVLLKTRAYVSNPVTGDSLLYRYYKSGKLQKTNRKRVTVTTDSFPAVAPAYGDTATYLGCAALKHKQGGALDPEQCWKTPWLYTRPQAPSTLDSVVQISVRGRSLVPGGPFALRVTNGVAQAPTDSNQAQFCAFGVLVSGTKVKSLNSSSDALCDELYQQFLTEKAG